MDLPMKTASLFLIPLLIPFGALLYVLAFYSNTPGEMTVRFAPGWSVTMPLTGTQGLVLRHEGYARSTVLYADNIGVLHEITLDDGNLSPWNPKSDVKE